MTIVHVQITATGDDAESGIYTITVDGEDVVSEVGLDEALPTLDYWTPDRWHINTVLGNLEAAVRDGIVSFSIDPDHP